jgi:hypothetical protein
MAAKEQAGQMRMRGICVVEKGIGFAPANFPEGECFCGKHSLALRITLDRCFFINTNEFAPHANHPIACPCSTATVPPDAATPLCA